LSAKRRLLPFYAILVFAIAGVSWGLLQWQISVHCRGFLTTGSQALEDGDYLAAVHALGQRLRQTSCEVQDAETHYKFAYARVRVPEADSKHIVKSIASLKKAVTFQPGMIEAWRELSLAWLGIREYDRASMAARKLVSLDPENHASQRLLITSLLATLRYSEVLEITKAELRKNGNRWWLYLARWSAEYKIDAKGMSLKAAAIKGLSDDQRLLIDAHVAALKGDTELARRSLVGIENRGNTDPLFLKTAVNLMIGMDMASVALDMLHDRRNALTGKMRQRFVELSLHAGRPEWVLNYLREQPANINLEPGLLLVGIMSASTLGYSDEQVEVLIRNGGVATSDTGHLWHNFLSAFAFSREISTRVESAEKVLELEPRNPHILQFLAGSWLSLGEARRAERLANTAAEIAPSWNQPVMTRVEALMQTGQYDEAFEIASSLSRRFPDEPRVAFQMARAWSANLQDSEQPFPPSLLALIKALQERTGVDLDIYLNEGQIVKRRRDIASTASSSPSLETAGVYVEEADDRVLKDEVSQTSVNALELFSRESIEKRTKLQDSRRCRDIESGNDLACWNSLLDKHEDDLNVYLYALDWAASRNRLDLQNELTQRLGDLVPTGSSLWRLARARSLLSENPSQKSVAEAVLLLRYTLFRAPDQAEAHLLMFVALAHLNDQSRAFTHLKSAVDSDPRRAVEALRVSLHLIATGVPINSKEIILAWKSITSKETNANPKFATDRQNLGGGKRFIADQRNRTLLARFVVLAEFAELYEHKRLAAAVYRQILRIDEDQDFAINNLAMILSENKSSLDEALKLAGKAKRLSPGNEDYQDTFDLIQVAISLKQN